MMIQEFEKLTGLTVTTSEYDTIEQMYYEFDGDKQAFCKDFVKNNRLVEVLREIAAGFQGELIDTQGNLELAMGSIERLKAELEREQEWKPWANERAVSQQDYDHLRKSGRQMTDAEAIEWIADEFGFSQEKIRVHRKMKIFEVNRHSQLRTTGETERDPYYDATDWYYVFFSVCGMEYEAYNGMLKQI